MAKRILIIDDSPHSLEMMSKALEQEGYEVTTAANGEDGVKRVLSDKPDLVVTDVVMQGESGIEICGRIKKKLGISSPKIIVITGIVDAMDAVSARKAGADDFCVKTEDMSLLVDAVKKLI